MKAGRRRSPWRDRGALPSRQRPALLFPALVLRRGDAPHSPVASTGVMAEPTVRMSGIVLASLMFQHANSDSDVDGLILGESRSEEQVTISDSQADHIHIEETYNVQKHIACPKPNHFYNSTGDVDLDVIKEILADNEQESVIGWYRQRRNMDQQMTFREKIVHEKLKASLSNPHMIFMLVTSGRFTPAGSTHQLEFTAVISRSGRFQNVPVLVNNLGLLEQQAYTKVSAPCSAARYSLTMRKHSSRFFSPDGGLREVGEVNSLNGSLQDELQAACAQVEESERQVAALRAEVSALRARLREQQGAAADQDQDQDPTELKKNLLLHRALRALLLSSPLLLTQTLTLSGFPVPELCYDPEDEKQESPETLGPTPERKTSTKRTREVLQGRERKRRRSKS